MPDPPPASKHPRVLSELTPAPYNDDVRSITKRSAGGLGFSMESFGDLSGITFNERTGQLVAGHRRIEQLQAAHGDLDVRPPSNGDDRGWIVTPDGDRWPVRFVDWSLKKEKAGSIAANSPAISGLFRPGLRGILDELEEGLPDVFGGGLFADLRDLLPREDVPPPPEDPCAGGGAEVHSELGEVYELGPHRILCGDSTDAELVATLVGDGEVTLLHADPPYGMGKVKDGILNDDLRREALDAFQTEWWEAWRPALRDNASVYVWGNAPDLWRWWYSYLAGLPEKLVLRNEIVWDKGTGFGMGSAEEHGYSPATERILFFMLGEQFLGNQNLDDYWEGWEPLRGWMESQRDAAGWKNGDVNELTGTHMAGHWFGRSQFHPISEAHYETLRKAADGRAFVTAYDEVFEQLFPGLRDEGNANRRELSAAMRQQRSFFDNTHAAMTDVWAFPRVQGEERWEHATPKPVALIARALRSSTPAGAIVAEPFLGSGSTLIAAAETGRVLVGMELHPPYVDVVRRRWTAWARAHDEDPGSGALDP